jgi:MerR family transcriptional regulator, light-induced transcriptional regulator
VKGLAIRDVAQQTGLATGTIRVWEQRYGFPDPERTPSGYRVYTPSDVDTLRRVVAYRSRGLSVPAALERARAAGGPTDRPSLFGAIVSGDDPVRPQRLRKPSLLAISRAIEDETLARAARPVVIASFQAERNYRAVEHRYRRLAHVADACVAFGGFDVLTGGDGEPVLVPVSADEAMGNEWAVVVDAPGYAACLLAWETPESQRDAAAPGRERCFEAVWTLDPRTVRRAALVGAALTRTAAPELAASVERLLQDRPLAVEEPAPALTALTNRIVGYLEG